MLIYPGGRVGDVESRGYAFFANFFSDLGQTRTYGGHDNRASLTLFCLALAVAAAAIAAFFAAFAELFARPPARRLGRASAFFGVVAALCFIGVAATPWNLYLRAHNEFVQWAFRAFLGAVVCAGAGTLLEPGFPRRYAAIFGAFAALLAVYIGLLAFGPRANTAPGALIQATAQKIIVYAAIATIVTQSLLVLRAPSLRERPLRADTGPAR
jgi:hypothetical protein